MKLSFDDYLFWAAILTVIAIILWMLHGSPTLEQAILSVGSMVITSELMLWRKYFATDKKTTISFLKLKHEMDTNFMILRRDIKDINVKLDNIEKLIKKSKAKI